MRCGTHFALKQLNEVGDILESGVGTDLIHGLVGCVQQKTRLPDSFGLQILRNRASRFLLEHA